MQVRKFVAIPRPQPSNWWSVVAATAEIKKLYYSIGELGALMDLESHVLRYWETEFEQLNPRRNRAGRRVYTAEDIAVVERILHLLRVEKYTIEGAKQVMRRDGVSRSGSAGRSGLLQLRSFLENIKDSIA